MPTIPLPFLKQIIPTLFLRAAEVGLERRLDVIVINPGATARMVLRVEQDGEWGAVRAVREIDLGEIPSGESTREVFIPNIDQEVEGKFFIRIGESLSDSLIISIKPPRRWTIHLVQESHHDLGYTGLPSHILRQHDRHLSEALDYARATDGYPEDAKFRIVIEQTWSLEHFLVNATTAKCEEMLRHLRSGRFEVNALYGNLTTELFSPEELIRALYPVARLKRLYGVPVTSAEHNDITGFSWGLAEALLGAGVRLLIPGLPLYYNWGYAGLESFWDQTTLLRNGGPDAFRWQTPAGGELLVWCNGSGCGGDSRASLPGLVETLERLERQDWPYQTLRWPVTGANSDNSPYRMDFSDTVRDWNARWVSPHLVSSTNARFYSDFSQEDLGAIKVFRGELPGQDYPVGAMSTAAATGVNRRTHAGLSNAETAATAASLLRGADYPQADLDEAWRGMILHDEHTWGFQFPAGPAAAAAQVEKAAHAFRAAALAQDVSAKALAALGVSSEGVVSGPCILVFNDLGTPRSGVIRMPLRPLDNIQRVLTPVTQPGAMEEYLQVTSLPGRDHVILSLDFLAGHFDLVDCATGRAVPYQIEELRDGETPLPFSAERLGLGSGSKRLGLFEVPLAVKLDLVFLAADVPSCGYKTYALRVRQQRTRPRFPNLLRQTAETIENEYYRVSADRSGLIRIYDNEAGRELIDEQAPHRLGALVVRAPEGRAWVSCQKTMRKGPSGPVSVSLDLRGDAHGHPSIYQRVTLAQGQKQVDLAVNVLKDTTPLLDAHLAFPFNIPQAQIRYEGVLAALTPVIDFLPGAQSDRLAVQNWVRVGNDQFSLLWSSLDAPVASLGNLWEGYVSPAHRCFLPESIRNHRRLTEEDFQRSWIYSLLFANNFGTNFAVSQTGYALFRYRFSTQIGPITDQAASAWGQAAVTELEPALFPGMPAVPSASLLHVDGAQVLAFKKAENGRGLILRVWNPGPGVSRCRVSFPGLDVSILRRTNLVEEDIGDPHRVSGAYSFDLHPGRPETMRLQV